VRNGLPDQRIGGWHVGHILGRTMNQVNDGRRCTGTGVFPQREMILTRGFDFRVSPASAWPMPRCAGASIGSFPNSSNIFPDVGLQAGAWLPHRHSYSETWPCHIDPRCRIGTSSSTF
jgi:hypothetical protein